MTPYTAKQDEEIRRFARRILRKKMLPKSINKVKTIETAIKNARELCLDYQGGTQ